MSGAAWTTDDLARLERLAGEGKNEVQIAPLLGRSVDAVRIKAQKLGVDLPPLRYGERNEPPPPAPAFEVADLPDELPTADELLARRAQQFAKKHAAKQARQLIPVKVNLHGPVGIAHMGDPHVDDDGTDIARVQRHVELFARTEGLLAGNVGDYQNNWIGRIAHLYSQQSLSAKEAWVLVEWLVRAVPWLYLIGGNHDCHDAETEALTRRGWLRHDDIRADDEVLSFVAETGAAEWSPILRQIVREHDGEMVEVSAATLNMAVTPNHRVLNKKRLSWGPSLRWASGYEYTTAADLIGRVAVPVSGQTDCPGVPLSDEQIAIAGWVLTDGSICWAGNSPKVTLYQSKSGAEIERLLSVLGLEHNHSVRHRKIPAICGVVLKREPRPQHAWTLTAEASRRVLGWLPEKGRLPGWANELSARQFQVLLDAIIAGDGCWDGKCPELKNVAVVHGTREFLSSLQAVAVQHGWNARLSVARVKDWRLNLCRREAVQFDTAKAKTARHYKGAVWCLTVPRGNFMVRRQGVAHFSGNCWSGAGDPLRWIAAQGGQLYEPNGARLGLTFPNGRVIRVNARHNWPGHSQWNAAHGVGKAVQMGHRDHVVTCGHTHVSGHMQLKDPASGLISHAVQVASYKTYDRYAEEKGLRDQKIYECPVTIIRPEFADDDPKLITFHTDPEDAASYLTWLRSRKVA